MRVTIPNFDAIPQWAKEAFESVVARVNSTFQQQHAGDGAHAAITATSVTSTAGIVVGELVGTYGNRVFSGSNGIAVGIPGTASGSVFFVVLDSVGNVEFALNSLGLGVFTTAYRAIHPTTPSGYSTGAGGTVAQGTSKATGVTLNKVSGQITLFNDALAGGAVVSFVVTNSAVVAVDVITVAVASGGTANAYRAAVTAVAAGSFTITVENITGGSLSESPVINFLVWKGASS